MKKNINGFVEEIKEDIESFTNVLEARGYILYAVTLTYRPRLWLGKTDSYRYYKIPKQKIAMRKDFKNFKDKMVKAYKRKNIFMECYFIFAKHQSKWGKHRRAHFHGIIAISRRKRIKDDVRYFWGKGFVEVKKIYFMKGWINYMGENITNSSNNYYGQYHVYTKTRIK